MESQLPLDFPQEFSQYELFKTGLMIVPSGVAAKTGVFGEDRELVYSPAQKESQSSRIL